MQVNSTSSTSPLAAYATTQTAKAASSEVDGAQFMKIMLSQLTHQNPLEPMDNAEMMSQFSQLNSLQELREIHSSMDVLSSANQTTYMASLIGKSIKAASPDGTVLEGVVDGVTLEKGNYQVRIGNLSVALGDILEINGGKA